jgi:peptide/nickel transport system substrate-binding protein
MKWLHLWLLLAAAMLSLGGGVTAAQAQESILQISAGGSDIATLDPHRATTNTDKALVGLIYNGLVRFTPGSADPKDLEPDLAERWEADGKTWTFFLRKGVKFHGNWGELTADDVVYSLTRAGDARRSTFAADFSAIESITKVDDYTVRIALKYPDANFLGRVSNYQAHSNLLAEKGQWLGGTNDGDHPNQLRVQSRYQRRQESCVAGTSLYYGPRPPRPCPVDDGRLSASDRRVHEPCRSTRTARRGL